MDHPVLGIGPGPEQRVLATHPPAVELSELLTDASLRGFYRELMESEARHYRLFCGLSEELFGVKLARARLSELALRESEVASQLPLGPKVHG
jgi:tRNA 2-(methylsulfanyl)-N6-isopentenyladenosine37 hydroxylase